MSIMRMVTMREVCFIESVHCHEMLTDKGQGSHSVLQAHQKRNRSIRPPDPNALLSGRRAPSSGDRSLDHQPTHTPSATHGRTANPQHSNAEARPSQDTRTSPDVQRPVDDEDGPDSSDNGTPAAAVVRRRTRKSRDKATSSQLGFYSEPWHAALCAAKNLFRLSIHTDDQDAFPERNAQNLEFVHQCLLEAISKAPPSILRGLDEGTFLLLLSTSAH